MFYLKIAFSFVVGLTLVTSLAFPPNSSPNSEEVIAPIQQESKKTNDELRRTGKNLIRNGNFSQVKDNQPAGWVQKTWSGSPIFSYARNLGHGDKTSVRIQSSEGADASWSFKVAVKSNTNYELSAWIKTKNLDTSSGGFGAQMNLHELQFDGKSKAIKGTQDWTKITTRFNSGSRTELLVNLLFGGWGRSKGEAWFDDVELFELTEPVIKMSPKEAIAFYETKVKPILKQHCMECHGEDPEDLGGELALISRKTILEGGDSGAAVNLDQPKSSLLLDAINYGTYEMPPDGKLSAEKIKVITTWVKLGLPMKKTDAEKTLGHSPKKSKVPQVNAENKKFWSFQKIVRPELPKIQNEKWATNEIDRFILHRLEAKKLSPAPVASKATLIRRVYYDLVGLPPTPKQVAEFLKDSSPDAYEKLVDRLLASPQYGEKWARHWLDVVRYAESNSFERDGTKPFVWHYRDYVIKAMNADKPYNRFLLEQLAGDEIENPTPETIIATGYYRLGQWDDEPADKELAVFDDLDDILATTSQAMIGLTIDCARCHDHKIDPIPQSDYYQMLSFFQNIRRYGVRAHDTVIAASTRQVGREPTQKEKDKFQEQVDRVKAKMAEVEKIVKADFESVEHEDFQYDQNKLPLIKKRIAKKVITQKQFNDYRHQFNQLKRLRENPPHLMRVLCVKEHERDPPESYVMIRGNAHVRGKKVEPAFVSILSPPKPEIKPLSNKKSSGRRLALAKWIISPDHPLTARVIVNRIWQHHFGRGIVRSANDFGFQGTLPTHPALLDWLADEFVKRGWSLKKMHKLILMSSTYRMNGKFNKSAYAVDPQNDLFWRFNIRRLTAEEVRDSILAVSGRLNVKKMYGPSIFPVLSREVLAGQSRPGDGWGRSSDEDVRRRSIYIHVKRSLRVPLLSNFDAADTDTSCPVRFNTTQPTQALGLLNSDFTNQESVKFAKIIADLHQDRRDQVKEILWRVTQREPKESEIQRGINLIKAWESEDRVDSKKALAFYCLLAINLNEFMFID